MSELRKIDAYFSEGRRLWRVNPDLVVSRRFFEMWEETHRPVPFALGPEPLRLAGQPVTVLEDDERIAWCQWDADDMRAVLFVEGATLEQRLLLGFIEGEPCIDETPPSLLGDKELTAGARLEVMFDVIAYLRDQCPGVNILDMTQKEFRQALHAVEPLHERQTMAAMRRLSAPFVRRLLRRAVEDMASDELSNQLSLPLGGNYAVASQFTPGTDGKSDAAQVAAFGSVCRGECVVAAETRWAVLRDLRLLATLHRLNAENESTYILSLADAQLIGTADTQHVPLRLPVDPSIPLLEGDRIPVYARHTNEPVGTLHIDLYDSTAVYGRLVWSGAASAVPELASLCARPRHSPARVIADSLKALCASLETTPDELSPALLAVLGWRDVALGEGVARADVPATLDASQARAWRDAVDTRNRVVSIQGPPGTGKTSVLEKVLRTMVADGRRVLVAAPSNTAVDNICRRVADLPVLRIGQNPDSIAPDVLAACWMGEVSHVETFAQRRREAQCGGIYAGTHVGLLRDHIVWRDRGKNGPYDAVVFDEAGMARLDEFLICAELGERVVLFGDHLQLPPFPIPGGVMQSLVDTMGPLTRRQRQFLTGSALEWLVEQRRFPVVLLQRSYRCQNPRLMRFSSILFYDARVRASDLADYYRLPYRERQRQYPAATLRLFRTSGLPAARRRERLVFEGQRPGLDNPLEAALCAQVLYEAAQRHPLRELTIIAPYRRQVRLIQKTLSPVRLRRVAPECRFDEEEWEWFLRTRIATVDSFQGGESDAVIVTYVRSNAGDGIGFVDDPNRINVAHTRCRREMVVIGDIECLKAQARSDLFTRMERAFARDGEVIDVDEAFVEQLDIGSA